MDASDFLQLGVFIAVLVSLAPLIGLYIALVFQEKKTFLNRFLSPVEHCLYRLARVDPKEEMDAKSYALSLLTFCFFGLLGLFLLQIFQNALFLNPQGFANVEWTLAFNTAVSFVTNTNWQAYAGESSLGYLVQGLGLGVQNFVSAACGMAVLLALVRGITRKNTSKIGNFWSDLTKTTLYILLPLSIIWAILLIGQGVIQNFSAYVSSFGLEGQQGLIPMGPAASQIAIKQLGTNGGGFFGLNSAHPFENPTPLSNFLEVLAILIIPVSTVYAFGLMIKAKKQAWALYLVMMVLFLLFLGLSLASEMTRNNALDISHSLEGKELRLGTSNSVLWAQATTATSSGSVSAMHDSLSPLSGGLALFQMLLGEVIFGGVGSGLYGMLLFVLLTVFLSGLMIGRTPEYMGKKIEAFEIKMVLIAILLPCAVVLIGASISVVSPEVLDNILNRGPHGFSEILYAWGSAANNNGSAFGGFNANTPANNLLLGFAMLLGRFGVIVPTLYLAQSLAQKKILPPSAGTLPTDSLLFGVLLISVLLLVGALTFMPAFVLGPLIEHLLMGAGRVF